MDIRQVREATGQCNFSGPQSTSHHGDIRVFDKHGRLKRTIQVGQGPKIQIYKDAEDHKRVSKSLASLE